ncbi:alpha/beta hydrolase [Actinophytocola sp.]|uniref:alpha/beta fold hydrolase n=1 Tax=Actinophytocola sp. TaxID=1872138 RepID=UPI002D4C9D9C|nr:alpha/beta hydrolase [Actinophytocola sp.]HYQ66338.1 alpha/beta hydrolase [Actinophytocola sp.]
MTTLHLARHEPGGDPVLLLLHGLGATGEVWDSLLERHWKGEVIAPDLPGHGRSPRPDTYTFESMAASVAAVLPEGRDVVVLGHSLGGVLALTLAATGRVAAACGVGIKLRWSEAELTKAAQVTARPERVFATREEAVDRWLKLSGLDGLVPPDSPLVDAGVLAPDARVPTPDTTTLTPDATAPDTGWRVAVDPAAFGVGAPDVPALLARATCPTILAAGERDPMCPPEHLLDAAPDGVVLPRAGHNVHVESPPLLWPILDRLLRSVTDALGQ